MGDVVGVREKSKSLKTMSNIFCDNTIPSFFIFDNLYKPVSNIFKS